MRFQKHPLLCVHIDQMRFQNPPLLCVHIDQMRFQKPPLLCVHIDQMRFQKPPFLWISTFDSVFKNLRFCGVFVEINVKTFTKTHGFCTKTEQCERGLNITVPHCGTAIAHKLSWLVGVFKIRKSLVWHVKFLTAESLC